MKNTILIAVLAVFLCFPVFAADNSIGNIKTIKGGVSVSRGAESLNPEPGFRIFDGDLLKTAESSGAGIIFSDGTLVTIGADTELLLNKYIFQPKDNEYAFDVYMKKGTAIYNSGRLGKLSPESVQFRTSKATIGIRGTKFFIKAD